MTILSPVLAGGASATWGFRRKRNRKVTAQNQANEFTRDIIALLKSCLNQGTSPDQLGNAVQKCDKSGSSLGVITPILTPFPPLLSLRVTPLVLSSCLFGSSRGFCPCSPKGRLFPPTWMIVVTAVSPATLRQSLSRWEAWSAGVGLLEGVAKTVAVGRRAAERSLLQSEFEPSMVSCWIRVLGACSYSSPRGLTPVESERVSAALQCLSLLGGLGFNLSHFLTNCRLFALSKVGFGCVARAPPLYASQRLFTAVWKNSRRVRFSNPWLRAMLLGGMSIWILLGSTGWLGVSSVALFGIAPVGLCVRARWRPVFMAGLSIGGGVLFGSGSGNTTSLLSVWIFSPLGFCPPFFLAWRAWPIIFVKDGEPGVFRSGPGRQARNATTRRSYQRYLSQLELPGHSGLGLVQWYSCHYCLGCDLLTGQFSGARSCEIYLSLA